MQYFGLSVILAFFLLGLYTPLDGSLCLVGMIGGYWIAFPNCYHKGG